jgi:DNA-directed RNA polymerase specialized sigma24 family protein
MHTQRRKRFRLSWVPSWEGVIEGWSRKFIRLHQWRCDSIHTPDDLIQDAYLIYLKVYERYPRIYDPPHFMALFQRAMWNNLNDHSRYARRKRLIHSEALAWILILVLCWPGLLAYLKKSNKP